MAQRNLRLKTMVSLNSFLVMAYLDPLGEGPSTWTLWGTRAPTDPSRGTGLEDRLLGFKSFKISLEVQIRDIVAPIFAVLSLSSGCTQTQKAGRKRKAKCKGNQQTAEGEMMLPRPPK